MALYRNAHWRFEITMPDGWKEPGFLKRAFNRYDSANPELIGSHEKIRVRYSKDSPEPNSEARLTFSIVPISPEPTVEQHQNDLAIIARRHHHFVREMGRITVLGKDHATMVYEIPRVGMSR